MTTNVLESLPKTIDLASRGLKEEAIQALQLRDEERITAVWNLKSTWIPYPRASEILRKATELLNRPAAYRMPCVLAFGAPGVGKTALQQEYLRRHPFRENLSGDAAIAHVVGIEVKGPDEGAFYNAILSVVGAPHGESGKPAEKLHQVLEILRRIGTRQLLIDELNTAIAGPYLRQKNFAHALKHLANQLKLSVFATGTQDAKLALAVDDQFRSRFEFCELRRWTFGDPFRSLLESFERRLPLRERSNLQAPQLAQTLFDLSEGYFSELSELLMRAAVSAIKSHNEKIDEATIHDLKWTTRSQR